ncbi:Mur ligase family protein [Paraglaciecola arctica]|uniref:Mur ligase family protein n=1 Tax=Paraglaciecola arctica BSs20135 TaxID=493475 RepID=K6Y141_9ALTE|nr:Mur ligase family protein [Paraglaciecola arctica]GAC17646.1 mur ligase family protein [Paraglaciecola arctica BSs20135]
MRLELDDARRLTGPNLLWDQPGAILDVFIDDIDKNTVVDVWHKWLAKLLAEFGWQQQTTYRLHSEGANLAISAPIDALYCACDLAELAWHCAVAELKNDFTPNWQQRLNELQDELAEELNPALITLIQEAKKHGVSCIADDDEVSLGMGKSSQTWPVRALPDLKSIKWQQYQDIPRVFITGTNGKSTSVRLASHIAKAAGYVAGVTSTDFIRVGGDIIDHGDYSGPGGARMLLRDQRTELAFLEVARGGILRRGIPIDSVDAALITNVASDHLGQYGINTVEELAETKFVVAKGLDAQGTLVLNADNKLVREQGLKLDKKVCWYSTDESNALIQSQIRSGGAAVFIRNKHIVYALGCDEEYIAALEQVPMTLNGAAEHNVQNALGVVGLCKALNLPTQAIRDGLKDFGSNAQDNPGRGNIYEIKGIKVLVDFAHNEHSMRAVVRTINQLPAKRKIAMFSHAGDRSDEEIRNLTAAVTELDASLYVVTELERYLRGREIGDVPEIVGNYLQQQSIPSEKIQYAANPLEGAKIAMDFAQPGDVVLLFVLSDREQVHEYLTQLTFLN